MIEYNVVEKEHKNHPDDGKYGVVTGNVGYANYPVTIVDNRGEYVDRKHKTATLCLIHLNERVRRYEYLMIGDEYLYKSFTFNSSMYKMYDYKYEDLTNDEIIKDLKTVLYYLEPNLQSRTLSYCGENIEDDTNQYEGSYVLNNEEEYTILKCKNEYKFYKGRKSYYPNWNKAEDLIYSGFIDFDVYKKSLELVNLRKVIVTKTNELLDGKELISKVGMFNQIDSELQNYINGIV